MKTQVLIILLLLANILLSAQEYQYVSFPDSNAVWSEVYWKPIGECPRWVYNKYALFNEDTIINSLTYHKLFHTNAIEITKENSVCIGVIREDDVKRVWFKDFIDSHEYSFLNEYGEILLYNFHLKINDTIRNYSDFTNIVGVDYLHINRIDTIKIENTLRRVFYFSNIQWEVWIEGIGKINGLLFPSGDLPANGIYNDLICFHQNDTLQYYYSGSGDIYYDDCVPQFVLDGVSILPNTEINVYPNPATGGVVYFEGLDFETLELFDINGAQVKGKNIKNMANCELELEGLPPGIYIYLLKTKGLIPTQGKLIVQ